jgi:3-dehydroquinate synthetase/threonine dehydrogenase-like Zn-dependent dehydrogenase/predicted NBD/HSP70 family sugar kinase
LKTNNMHASAQFSSNQTYGVHECVDRHGNHGTKILSQRDIKVSTTCASGLFDPSHEQSHMSLVDAFSPEGNVKRKLLVVVDGRLPESRRIQIEAYFVWCKTEELIQDFFIKTLTIPQVEKTVKQVSSLVKVAKQCGLKRRDLFVAIGSTTMTDLVGFTAAIYRRSTPWILIPHDLVGILRCPAYDTKLSANHVHGGTLHKATFALSHPPIASFYDPSDFSSLPEEDLRRGLAEIIKISVHQDGNLFSFLEAQSEKILGRPSDVTCLKTAVELATRAVLKGLDEVENDVHPSTISFGNEVAQAFEKIKGIAHDEGHSTALGVAVTSAFSFLKGYMSITDLRRILSLLRKAGLPIYDKTLQPNRLWEHIMGTIEEGGAFTVTVPIVLGQGGYLNVTELSQEDISAALSVLRKHRSEISNGSPEPEIVASTVDVPDMVDGLQESFHERIASEDTRYHVITVPGIFRTSNTTLVQDYCMEKKCGRKKKILIVVDDQVGSSVIADIDGYFKRYRSAIDDFYILPMRVSSNGKDMDSTLTVVDAAMEFGVAQRDLLVVVGGGTLMDIVGFAASMFKGGIPYVRIPTTLIGMIDAGVGIKTGVNVDGHKSAIGRYFAPVACLNDPETFLLSLPRREFASGLAEAIKMALLKSPRLFEVIETYHCNAEYNGYTHELIHISIHTMLEELQPNLHEHDLRRSVDFGHEFGHIVESLARHEIPHGECVAVGMAISSLLAHMKGILSRPDLERILNCILSLGLPIYARDYGCCKADVLWAKICTEGIEHKDGMLWLAIPETIGQGGFLDNISDIDADMVNEALFCLREYADRYREGSTLRTVALKNDLKMGDGKPSVPNPEGSKPFLSESEREQEQAMAAKWKEFSRYWNRPNVIVVDIGATYLRVGIMGPNGLLLGQAARIPSPSKQSHPQDTVAMLQERLLQTLAREICNVRASHSHLLLEEVGISFGAVITSEGVVKDASILWTDAAQGYDFKNALRERLPGFRLTVLNDISAAAWRYKDEKRFCLVTVSSGLSNKVFNVDLDVPAKLDLDAAGIGGEMGHVVVEPRAVDSLIQRAIQQAMAHPEELQRSQLNNYVKGNPQKISARHLAMAFKEGDEFAQRLLEEADVPYCPCGNLADLCSYSSGRGALRRAQILAARGEYGNAVNDITDSWLQQGIETAHPLALRVLYESTYPLALRILQLAADIGLRKFIIVGGFAMKTGKKEYLRTLQDHLVRLCHYSAFFSDWSEDEVRGLVRFGVDDDNDGLIGMGHFVQHLRAQYRAVEKAVGEQSLAVVTRPMPRCGALEVLAKVVYSGICTTDLQILRGERGLEPVVLGHEGVCQVVDVGKDVKGVNAGEMILLNPNNPLDDYDKLGHTKEGMFQEYVKFGEEFLERGQVLRLGRGIASPTDTLIEPLGGVVAALDRIKDRVAGKNVLVLGAGLIGLMFVTMMGETDARNVFLANRSQERLNFAVTRGIIPEKKTFVVDGSIASELNKVSSGEGADVIIVCVSLGQGRSAAQDALSNVNAGGSLYLFAGFRSGDVLTLDEGEQADIWSLRCGWKTEQIQYAGKSVDLIGQRGSRNEDLAAAADVICRDSLSFGRMISHIISLDVLPDVMLSLARDGNVKGVPAKRVVVDMDARERVIETAEELPLRHLYEAASKPKDAIPVGNPFREIGFQGDASSLGWVYPPVWQDIEGTIKKALKMRSLSSKRHFIWVGTGPWVFLVDALKDIVPARQDVTFHTLHSLDPQALTDLLACIDDLSMAVCLGMSQSGTTIETVMLMNALRERFDGAELDHREHFIWLTEMGKSKGNYKSGETTIRRFKDHNWKDVDMIPLTIGNQSGINALFCTPHSAPMFLGLGLLLQKDLKAMRRMYQQYLASRDKVDHDILPKAYSVASNHIDNIQLCLDEEIAPAMVKLATQLIEQGLGSKQIGFNPRVHVALSSQKAGLDAIALPMPSEASAVVKAMLTMNALSAFVAVVAYHRRIQFVTHPKVDMYKRKAVELAAGIEVEQKTSNRESISTEVLAHLQSSPGTQFVEVLCYGHVGEPHQQSVKDWLTSDLASLTRPISIGVSPGEVWNHSRYQAAVQRDDTLYVVLVSQVYWSQVEGIPEGITRGNIRMLQAIAHATHQTLIPKALCFQIGENFGK